MTKQQLKQYLKDEFLRKTLNQKIEIQVAKKNLVAALNVAKQTKNF